MSKKKPQSITKFKGSLVPGAISWRSSGEREPLRGVQAREPVHSLPWSWEEEGSFRKPEVGGKGPREKVSETEVLAGQAGAVCRTG